MPFWFTLFMMILFSAVPTASAWAFAQRLPQIARIMVSIVAGMAPLSLLALLVFRSGGGNSDFNPLQFCYLMVAISFAGAVLAVIAMEWRLRRK